MAGRTGLEPAPSSVTGWRYNQLNYRPEPLLSALEQLREPLLPRDPELRAVDISHRLGELRHDPRGLPPSRCGRVVEVEPVGHQPVVPELVEHQVEWDAVRVYEGEHPSDDDDALRCFTDGPATSES